MGASVHQLQGMWWEAGSTMCLYKVSLRMNWVCLCLSCTLLFCLCLCRHSVLVRASASATLALYATKYQRGIMGPLDQNLWPCSFWCELEWWTEISAKFVWRGWPSKLGQVWDFCHKAWVAMDMPLLGLEALSGPTLPLHLKLWFLKGAAGVPCFSSGPPVRVACVLIS